MAPYYTPLRYPGGKGKLAAFIKRIFEVNELIDGAYAEPYAGGAGVALTLLFHEYANRVYINDVSPAVGAFWRCVLNRTDELCQLISDTRVSLTQWRRQRDIFQRGRAAGDLALGFATFFLNRTNRSGILDGGVIGGLDQEGPWKIDARYKTRELISRIESIAKMRSRITFTQLDALDFLCMASAELPQQSLVYLDPPYYLKGKELYLHHYEPDDHAMIASLAPEMLTEQKWIVSYDNVAEVRRLYKSFRRVTYQLSYSAQERYKGGEIMFFGPGVKIPNLCGTMRKAA